MRTIPWDYNEDDLDNADSYLGGYREGELYQAEPAEAIFYVATSLANKNIKIKSKAKRKKKKIIIMKKKTRKKRTRKH